MQKNVSIRTQRQILLSMKFLFLFVLIAGIQANAKVKSQEINYSAKNIPIKKALDVIKKQSGYVFFYTRGTLDNTQPVTLDLKNAGIEASLKACFKNQPLTFRIENKTILVERKVIPKTPLPVYLKFWQEPIVIQNIVHGRVSDSSGNPISGVSVLIKGTSKGTVTNANGEYRLVVDKDQILVFSYIGYQNKEVPIGADNEINVELKLQIANLNDLVIIGYGTQKKSDLTGAITTIKGSELTKIAGSNAAEGLQGKAPGVQILSQGGPGAAPVVYVRGLGTNGDASPLYVVDGMMVSNITFLAPSDIQSMEILKDASATAIYGSRGANGVILITTKKGKVGKPVFNVNASQGFQYLTRKYEVGNARQYADLVNLFQRNAGKPALYSDAQLDSIGKGGDGTDWLDKSLQSGYIGDYSVSAAGGTNEVSYNLSLTYHKEEGILKYTKFDRLTIRANNEYKLTKKLTLGDNISFSKSNHWGDAQWNGGRGINSIYRISPLLSVYQGSSNDFTPGQDPDVINPVAALYYNKDVHNSPYQIVGNGYLNWELIKGLTFRSSYGVDYTNTHINNYIPAFNVSSPNQIQAASTLESGYSTNFTWLWENTLNYDMIFNGDHHINLLGGYTAQNTDYNIVDLIGSGLSSSDPNYRYIQAIPTSNTAYNGLPSSESMTSWLGRANYSYKGKYLLTASIRGDGSSKFAEGNRWGYFPSFAAGWNISKEHFMRNLDWINNLKIRGSWGQIGNNKIANYQTFSTLNTNDAQFGPVYDAVFNGVYYPYAAIYTASNPNITWEVSQQTDLGLEMALLDNRLTIEADYYNRKTKNLLLILPIPGSSTGFSATYSNVGSVLNKGFEFSVGWQENKHAFSYGAKFTGSVNKNKVLEFGGQKSYFSDWMVNSQHTIQEGLPIGDFYGYKVQGIAQTQAQINELNSNAASKSGIADKQYWSNLKPGDLIFEDINGDGFIDTKDQTDLGSAYAKFIGGLTLNAAYKGFDFSIDMMGSFGSKIYNNARNQILTSGLSNMNVEWLNSWTVDQPSTTLPRYASGTSLSQVSDFNIQNGNYLKARYIELGYTFKGQWLHRAKISSLRIYANAVNAFYITKYKGFSPEVNNGYSNASIGDDFRTYPITGTAKLGINIIF